MTPTTAATSSATASTAPPHWRRWLVAVAVGCVVAWQSWDASSLGDPSHRWALVALVAVAVVLGELLPDALVALADPGRLTAVLVVSLAAIYGCVPETDHIPVVALVLVAGFVIELATRRTMPIAWFVASLGLVMWAGMFGATGRERAIVGTLFAPWPIVLVALTERLVPRRRPSGRVSGLVIPAIAGIAVLVVARTGALHGERHSALVSVGYATGASVLAVMLCLVIARPRAGVSP